jgi:DNA-binding transcriptional regulator YdaS (Cro superfamily)
MEELRFYINSLSTEQREAFATACGTSIGYLRKAICIGSKLDGALARRVEEASFGHVKKEMLRPDIWPELVAA